MNGMINWWASNKVAANLLMVAILVGGLVSIFTINREIDPYVEFPGAQVSVVWRGASPQDVEEQIVTRLEEAVGRLDGVDRLWSVAREGVGRVIVVGEENLDENEFLQEIKRVVDTINTFPDAAEEPQLSVFKSRNELMRIAVSGEEDVSERALSRYAEKVRRDVALMAYVPAVETFGVRGEEVSIEVSETSLRRYGLTLQDVVGAVRGTSVNLSFGNVRTGLGDVQLRTRNLADTKTEFEDIVVRQLPSGAVVRVRDMAQVKDGFEEVNLLATVNGKRTILINILSGPDMDIVKMSKEVKTYLTKESERSPEGMSLTLWNDESRAFFSRMKTLGASFFSGLALVVVTLVLFLNIRVALWVAAGIGVAFAGGLAFLPLMDVSLNMISTFAFLLVIGVIVDDAIIVGEAIYSKVEEGEEGLQAAVNGTRMVLMPVIFAVLTTMIFFAPWMFISGGTSEFTRAISLVVILALIFSLVESLLILPAHLSHLKEKRSLGAFGRFQRKMSGSILWLADHVYRPVIVFVLRRRYFVAMSFLGLMILSVGLLANGLVKTAFLPEVESDQISINVDLPEGTPYSRTKEVLEQIKLAQAALEEEINKQTEGTGELIENWYTRSRDNQVLALVKLVPPETRSLTAKETSERLRDLIGDVPDAEKINVSYKGGSDGPPIEYVLNSDNLEDLTVAAEDLMAKLRSYDGVFNVTNDTQSASDEVRFTLKPGAEALGITTIEVARQVRQGFYGEEVQRLPRDGKDVRVFVRYPRADRESLDHLKNMRIRTSDGREVPLYTVAELEYAKGISQILRRERQRAIIVSAEVVTERIDEIRKELSENYFDTFDAQYPNVRRGNIGRAQGEAEFFSEMGVLLLIAIGVAYFLVAVAFRSYAQPALILLAAIPFCFAGAIFGHLIMGYSVSLFSYLGLMAAAGVAVNDNLVLIDYVNRLRREEGMDGAEALIKAGVRRFRPILLTSLTTFVGLFPLMMERSIQAAYLVPVGIGLAFGVLFAFFVTLLFVPALYGIGVDIRRYFVYIFTGQKQPDFDEALYEVDGEEELLPEASSPSLAE